MKIYIISVSHEYADEEPLIIKAFRSLSEAKAEIKKRKKKSNGDYSITTCDLEDDGSYYLTN